MEIVDNTASVKDIFLCLENWFVLLEYNHGFSDIDSKQFSKAFFTSVQE